MPAVALRSPGLLSDGVVFRKKAKGNHL